MTRPLRIGGLIPLTTTDFPGKLAAVVFCQGCPWRCAYCHNPHLQARPEQAPRTWAEVRGFLARRVGLLDGVVFSGGEPTLQAGLAEAMREARDLGFAVGLHSAGTYPERLPALLELADWIGLDIKAPFADYDRVTGVPGSGADARAALGHVLAAGTAHEVRTTLHPALLDGAGLLALARELAALGVTDYVVQEFRPQGCADATLCQAAAGMPNDEVMAAIAALFPRFDVRRA